MDGRRNSKINQVAAPLAQLHACSTPILKSQPNIGSLLQTWNKSVPKLYKYPSSQLEVLVETKSGKIQRLKKKRGSVDTNHPGTSFIYFDNPSVEKKPLDVELVNEMKTGEISISNPGIGKNMSDQEQITVTDMGTQASILNHLSDDVMFVTEKPITEVEGNYVCTKCLEYVSELDNVKDCLRVSEQLVETLEEENNVLRNQIIKLVVNLKKNQKLNFYLAKHLSDLKGVISHSDKQNSKIEGLSPSSEELSFEGIQESFKRITSKLNSFNCSLSHSKS